MRLGDHMMLIQLQLSTVSPSGSRRTRLQPSHSHSHHDHHGLGSSRSSSHNHPLTPPYTPHTTTCSGYSPAHTANLSSQTSSLPATAMTMNTSHATAAAATPSLSAASNSTSTRASSPSSPSSSSSTSSSPSGSNTSSPTGLGYDDLPIRGCPHRGEDTDPRASLDTKALAEASRNLTQTLKQLSSEVLTSKPDQKEDRQGRPKRDISTIIHILNDLLCATPQYRRHSTNITLSTSSPTTSQGKTSSGSSGAGLQQVNVASATAALQPQDNLAESAGRKNTGTTQTTEQGDENQAMRTKVEQLRLIMEQRRARRKARRDARARPYPTTPSSWTSDTTVPTVVTTSSTTTSATQAMDVDSGTAEGTDPTALCELNSETVVA
ncbi:Midnolin-A [Portunus trituberculatus]|uniref:Midnolin-A n=1 Tax=Portunus trituberculatus TaxID=210409 RepID=A0A5B7DLU7_PORTR|nr:Midnolin-A [Portunus trituberculatus]